MARTAFVPLRDSRGSVICLGLFQRTQKRLRNIRLSVSTITQKTSQPISIKCEIKFVGEPNRFSRMGQNVVFFTFLGKIESLKVG